MKRILFLTQGDLKTASSFHRVYQFLPALEKAGYEAVVHPSVKGDEFDQTFITRSWQGNVNRLVRTFTRRVRDLHQLRDFDYVFVQKPILPAPFFNIESKILRESKMIFDMDDAVFLKRPGGVFLTNLWPQTQRVGGICRRAHRVTVGNEYLAGFARKFGATPTILPTVVDTDAYAAGSKLAKHAQKIPVIGWVGSPSTQPDLDLVVSSLIDLHSRTPFVVRIIGGSPSAMPVRFPIEWKNWSLQTAIEDVAHLDVGLAPLNNTPWNEGKCGLKVLQYWAAGVPVVASPVGHYKEIIRDGENGLLASSREEWAEKLLLLIKNPELRRKIVEGGRKTVEEHFSLNAITPRFLSIFEEPGENKPSEQ